MANQSTAEKVAEANSQVLFVANELGGSCTTLGSDARFQFDDGSEILISIATGRVLKVGYWKEVA